MVNNGKRILWRGVPREKSVDHNRERIENLSKASAVKEKVIHLDQLEFLPIFL